MVMLSEEESFRIYDARKRTRLKEDDHRFEPEEVIPPKLSRPKRAPPDKTEMGDARRATMRSSDAPRRGEWPPPFKEERKILGHDARRDTSW